MGRIGFGAAWAITGASGRLAVPELQRARSNTSYGQHWLKLIETTMAKWVATRRRLRDRWALTSVAVAVVLIVTAASYAAWVYSAATNVESMLDRAEELDVAAIASGDRGALSAARSLVDDSRSATGSLSSRLGPSRVVAASFGWVPWAGDQLRAPGLLTARAEAALRSTSPLIAAADDLFLLHGLVTTDGLTGNGADGELDRIIESLELRAVESEPLMADIRSTAAEMDGLALIGLFDSRARRVSSLEERWLAFGDLLMAAPAAISAARDVAGTASDVIDELNSVTSSVSLETITVSVTRLAVDSKRAAFSLSQFETSTQNAMPGTEFSVLISDLSVSMNAVSELSSGLSTIAGSFGTALEILKEARGPLLSKGDELQRALVFLVSQSEVLSKATASSTGALEVLRQQVVLGRADFLPSDVHEALTEQTTVLVNAGKLMEAGPELLLDLIAANTTKKYLVLGQSSDELRAAGGFTSSAWTLTFSDGSLTDTEYIPVLEFESPASAGNAPPPAGPLAYYMDAGALYLRDVGWDPDFASVGGLATELYRLNQPGEVDGVIAVTQWGIIRLVDAVGGIDVNDEFISPADTLRVIEERTDDEGTGFLQELFVGLLESLRGDATAGTQFELLKALGEIVDHKDLMLFNVDPTVQARIEALDWAGRFTGSDGDRLAVVDANVGWSKSDRSILRNAIYRVDLTRLDRPSAEMTLRYRNLGSEIGRDCGLQSVPPQQFVLYSSSSNSCYWNYIRAYVASGALLVSASELPLPENSVPDQLNVQEPGTPTFSHEFDESGDHFAGLIAVGPGEEQEFSVRYLLPSSVVERAEAGPVYKLELVAQPGARGRNVTVTVVLPAGHTVNSSSHAPVTSSDSELTFKFDLQTDQVLRLELSPG